MREGRGSKVLEVEQWNDRELKEWLTSPSEERRDDIIEGENNPFGRMPRSYFGGMQLKLYVWLLEYVCLLTEMHI
jgi:hypothetical protein